MNHRQAWVVPSVFFSWFWIVLAVSMWAGLIALAMRITPVSAPRHVLSAHGHQPTHASAMAATHLSSDHTAPVSEDIKNTESTTKPTQDPRMSMLVGDPSFDLLMNDEAYMLSSNLAPLLLFMANNQDASDQSSLTNPQANHTLPDDERIFGNLNDQERMVLNDFATIWGHLNADKRQMLRHRARLYAATADDQLKDALTRWEGWSELAPDARQRVQNNHDMIQALPPHQQKTLMHAEAQFQLLSQEARDALNEQLASDPKQAQRRIKTQWEALTTKIDASNEAPTDQQTDTPNEQVELDPVAQ